MKLSNYLEDAIGSKSKIRVLRMLHTFPEKIWSIRELAGASGITHPGILKLLPDLVQNNVVTKTRHGNAGVIKLNKESYMYKHLLKNLLTGEDKTRQALIEDIKKNLPHQMIFAAIFGSVAKGEETYESDIDLLVVTKDTEKVEAELYRLSQLVAQRYGNEVIAFVFSPKDLKHKQTFIKNIRASAIVLKGTWQ